MTSMSYLDSPLTSPEDPPWPSLPRRYRSFTDAERRKLQEYGEEYARFVGPDYWKLPPVESVQNDAECHNLQELDEEYARFFGPDYWVENMEKRSGG